MSVIIREARPTDAKETVRLIYAAYGDFANLICASQHKELILNRLAHYFSYSKPTMVHYSHYSLLIETETNQIIGAVGCLRGDFIPIFYMNLAEALAQMGGQIDEEIQKSIRAVVQTREALDDEFYLDVLAVDPLFQGKNYADLLMEEAIRRGNLTNLPYLVLLARNNLINFYLSKGFSFHKRRIVGYIEYNVLYQRLKAPLSDDDELLVTPR